MMWKGIEHYKREIRRMRDLANQNNIFRTFYYQEYWKDHPEVPWALLAHLVSRNAGYQMSDADRFQRQILLKTYDPTVIYGRLGTKHLEAFFAFLETGNFLIFRDVCPALEAYKFAKQFPEHSDELFNMLSSAFDVDLFMVDSWKNFYQTARNNNWSSEWTNAWMATSEAQTDIQQHTFALIVNEQNQIHDRIILNNAYLSNFNLFYWDSINELLELATNQGWTKLCFPIAKGLGDPNPDHVLIYSVGDFRKIEERIQTGRDLFVGLFSSLNQRNLIATWAMHQFHSGSRRDYNKENYSYSVVALTSFGDVFSPPIGYYDERDYQPQRLDVLEPVWPFDPGNVKPYSLLHEEPLKIPMRPVETWIDTKPWLSPLTTPQKPLTPCQLSETCEIDKGWYMID